MTNNLYFKNFVRNADESFEGDDDGKTLGLTEIVNELRNGKKVFLFYPYKKDMEIVKQSIELKSKKKCIAYNADVDDDIKKTLSDVNRSNYDYVLTNTCITCGVNFDLNRFDSCWLFVAGFIKPRDLIQVSARVRHLQSKTINVVYLGKKLVNPAVYENDTKLINNPVYDTIYNSFYIEDKAFEIFFQKAGYKMDKSILLIDTQLQKEIKKYLMKLIVLYYLKI